jgi:hypothetical protein
MPAVIPGRIEWEQLLRELLDFQGYSVMVQVTDVHEERRHTPVLTAFGVMSGGLAEEHGAEMVALNLASSHRGSNGVLSLRRPDFEWGERTGDQLTIAYAGMLVGIVRQGERHAELEAEEGRPDIMRGTVVDAPEDSDLPSS